MTDWLSVERSLRPGKNVPECWRKLYREEFGIRRMVAAAKEAEMKKMEVGSVYLILDRVLEFAT